MTYHLFNNILRGRKYQEYVLRKVGYILTYINITVHKTDETNKFIWYDKATGFVINSPFGATYIFNPESEKNCPQLNFKTLYTDNSFVTEKILCLKKIL